MTHSKRSHEGWIVFDHRAGEGIGDGPLRGGSCFEAPTLTCGHCQRVMVVNPLRNRERGYCRKCDHYVCDECEVARVASGYECRSFERLIEEVQERALRDAL
jgi:hypothetical protein